MNDVSPTINNTDILSAVRDSAVLASLSMGMWSGVKTDKNRVDELKATHGAVGDVGRFNKNLLPGVDSPLKAVRSAFSSVYTWHRQATIPWGKGGQGLVSNLRIESYLTEIAVRRKAALDKKEEFLYQYPSLIPQAQANLGSMSDVAYPTVEEVRAAFYIDVELEPIADKNSGAFKSLGEIWGPRLQAAMEARYKQRAQKGQQEMWDRVKSPVEKLIKDLIELNNDEDKRFFDSSIQHVRDLLTLLPGWNLIGDPRVDQTVAELNNMLDNLDHKSAKSSPSVRANAISVGQTVMDRLNAMVV